MAPRIDELTARVRTSKFGREVLGPKIVAPVAGWLQENLVPHDSDGDDSGAAGAVSTSEAKTASAVAWAGTPSDARSPAVGPRVVVETESESDVDVRAEALSAVADDDGQSEQTVPSAQPPTFVGAIKSLGRQIKEHNLVVVAAGIAFWGLLAIPAVLFATVSVAGMVLDPATVKDEVNSNLSGLPEEARTIIGDQLASVSSSNTGGLIAGVVFGLLLALWTSSGAVAKLMAALNTTYGVTEERNFAKLRGTALLLTFGGILFVAGSVFLLTILPVLLDEIDGVGDSAELLFGILRFPALGIAMVVGLGVLYHLGPDRESRYRIFTLGAVVATVLWVGLSALFSIYTSTLATYNETYGSIGGIVVLLLWLFITAFVVLLGAEVHAHMTRREETTSRRT